MPELNAFRLIEFIGRGLFPFLAAVPFAASAATLSLSGDQLIGARGVMVDGAYYDVEFLDGTCIDLFDGCDDAASDFVFQTEIAARSASQALLDQVFVDIYDTDQSLTRGCTTADACWALTPYALLSPTVLPVANAINGASEANDTVLSGGAISPTTDLAVIPSSNSAYSQSWTFAVWSRADAPPVNVPEPSTLALLGLGLFGVAAMRRRWTSI